MASSFSASAAFSSSSRRVLLLLQRHPLSTNSSVTSFNLVPRSISSSSAAAVPRKSFHLHKHSVFANSTRRAMSSSADPVAAAAAAAAAPARKFEWLVVVPDTPGALEKRKEIRSQHLGGLKPAVESGLLKMGGAILEEVPSEDDPTNLKMCGSTLIIVAASKDDILEALNKDIYAQTGVWDVAKAQMWPLVTAFRTLVEKK